MEAIEDDDGEADVGLLGIAVGGGEIVVDDLLDTQQGSDDLVPTLESLALDRYLLYLESESVSYVSLCQSPGLLLAGLAPRLLRGLKTQIDEAMSGVASAVLRQRMMERILAEEFPTARHCQRVALLKRDDGSSSSSSQGGPSSPPHPPSPAVVGAAAAGGIGGGGSVHNHHSCLDDGVGDNCISPCCSGAFIRETMAGVVMSADVRELLFTAERMPCAAKAASLLQRSGPRHALPAAAAAEFNVPAVLTHLLQATQGRFSQLERIVFSESFVREESAVSATVAPGGGTVEGPSANVHHIHRDILFKRLRAKQDEFSRQFGQGGICDSSDRRGVALNMLVLFRDVTPIHHGFHKLTELVLKNNIQCDLYSKANFQFELLARVGTACPRLRVLDIFGTDTWADCLVAFFFKDAFHSLHRYLFFMENEDDETSAYHPHDTSRYCQFCLDQLHPNAVERPYTINPVIPLLDDIYDHVLRRYPKRSFCILRNCVRVSDLISSTKSNVFELVRQDSALAVAAGGRHETDPLCVDSISLRLRSSTTAAGNNSRGGLRSGRLLRRDVKTAAGKSVGFGGSGRTKGGRKMMLAVGEDTKLPVTVIRELADEQQHPSRRSGRLMAAKQKRGEEVCDRTASHSPSRVSAPAKILTVAAAVASIRSTDSNPGSSSSSNSRLSRASCNPGSQAAGGKVAGIVTRSRKRKLEMEEEHYVTVRKSARKSTASSSATASTSTAATTPDCSWNSRTSQCSNINVSSSSSPYDRVKQRPEIAPSIADSSEPIFCDLRPERSTISYCQWLARTSQCYCKKTEKCDAGRTDSSNGGGGSYHLSSSYSSAIPSRCESVVKWSCEQDWVEPDLVQYRSITDWPHLNECVSTLEVLNIGGTNVLGEFLPFILLSCKRLRSLGQWINTMIYGIEILRRLPGQEDATFPHIEEFSYSTDRNYFCQPYIGFVPESAEFRNVRKEMVRFSGKVARRINNSARNHSQKRNQIEEDMKLLRETCANVRKLNLVLHYKNVVLDESEAKPWLHLASLDNLVEVDLVTMKFANVKSLIKAIGSKLSTLTLEMDDEQGTGSEIVHIGRHCPNLTSLRLLIGDKVLKGEMTLHFGSHFFRKLERLTVEGSVHLHAFAFLWGHCRRLRYMKLGLVVSNELLSTNVLIHDVLTLMFQVNGMEMLEEMHIKNLKIQSLQMGKFLLDSLPRLRRASHWILDISSEENLAAFKSHLKIFTDKGFRLEYKESWTW